MVIGTNNINNTYILVHAYIDNIESEILLTYFCYFRAHFVGGCCCCGEEGDTPG